MLGRGRGNGWFNSWTRTAFNCSLTLEPENKNEMKELLSWSSQRLLMEKGLEKGFVQGRCSRPGCEILVRRGEGCKGEGKGEQKEGRDEREKAVSKACLGQGGFFRHR